jgi:hypothetical protein
MTAAPEETDGSRKYAASTQSQRTAGRHPPSKRSCSENSPQPRFFGSRFVEEHETSGAEGSHFEKCFTGKGARIGI